jgi:hypothetical protein
MINRKMSKPSISNFVNIVNDATCLRKYIPLSRGKTYISNFIEQKNLSFLKISLEQKDPT